MYTSVQNFEREKSSLARLSGCKNKDLEYKIKAFGKNIFKKKRKRIYPGQFLFYFPNKNRLL